MYNYNDKTQLSTATLRGGIAEQFGYDTAGDQTGATYTDTHADTSIADSSGTLDDQGAEKGTRFDNGSRAESGERRARG